MLELKQILWGFTKGATFVFGVGAFFAKISKMWDKDDQAAHIGYAHDCNALRWLFYD